MEIFLTFTILKAIKVQEKKRVCTRVLLIFLSLWGFINFSPSTPLRSTALSGGITVANTIDNHCPLRSPQKDTHWETVY